MMSLLLSMTFLAMAADDAPLLVRVPVEETRQLVSGSTMRLAQYPDLGVTRFTRDGRIIEPGEDGVSEGRYAVGENGICIRLGSAAETCRTLHRDSAGSYYMHYPDRGILVGVLFTGKGG